jgi:hypothetical protein
MAGKILLLLTAGIILSIYVYDMLGCIFQSSSIPVFESITFAALLIGTIIGVAILQIKKKRFY